MVQIDIRETYSFGEYSFKNYTMLTLAEKEQMLEWRNHETIRKNMYNTQPIPLENHLAFIESLLSRKDRYYWMVCENGKPVGSLNIVDVDTDKESAELGYYMAPEFLGTSSGIFFINNVLAFAFDVLKLQSLYGATNVKNRVAAYIDEYYGFERTGEKILIIDGAEVKFDEHQLTVESFNKNREEKVNIENVLKFFKEKKKAIKNKE